MSDKLNYPFPDIPVEGEAIEVATGILWMRLPLPMKLDHVNVYALDEGDSWTLIDTGFFSKRGVAIWEGLMAGPLQGKPVSRVIVTHHHPDHIGMAGWFQTEHGAELVTTRTAWLMARMLVLDVQDRPNAQQLQFWKQAGMDPEVFAQRAQERPFNFADCVAPMPLGYRRIKEGDVLFAGGRDWTVRIGNGHAPEHATLWADDVVLGGDQLLPSISPNLGVYPTEPDADPVSDWLEACERLATSSTPDQLVLPGHKLPFTGLPLRMRQLIDNHHGALERLLEYLDTPKSAHDCFLPLFKREIRGGEYGLALVESVAHCAHLYLAGQTTRSLREDGAHVYQRKEA
ncbi:MBL fold metallo-hydrolase [uncultured Litoreibacter sp.]|uniref:MBL fold metallo-hydrolase n=1 Tax=uncultured Litoreibacter sp. TaxID=1392394 RepID=UPI002615A4AA|nr:MBL fold metallo-hydrolase [uncultured Litoreibacter sp.]